METRYRPIEVTTHNIYFHEESPILSADCHDGIVATSGHDAIRLWTASFKEMGYIDSVYKTAANSSVSLTLSGELRGFTKPINCVRFYKGSCLWKAGHVIAACSDGGRVLVFFGSTCATVRGDDGDDAYELHWAGERLVVGFSSGRVEVYRAAENPAATSGKCDGPSSPNALSTHEATGCKECIPVDFSLCIDQKIHDGAIQGISIDRDLMATYSVDRSVKIHLILDEKLALVSVLSRRVDYSGGIFKRILLDKNLLYVFIRSNLVNVYAYPFREVHLHKRIGPLGSPVVKVIKSGAFLVLCTKKSVCILENDNTVCCIENSCYMAITDGFMLDRTLFLSSMDGFMTTVRLSAPD